MYGTQTQEKYINVTFAFENDVKLYGTQTNLTVNTRYGMFENDVKLYGTQTGGRQQGKRVGLRMM